MASTRFPNKPLAPIAGIPMIGHVYLRARFAKRIADVYVATCDEEIREYCDSIGARCVMTSPEHQGASDRTAEAVDQVERQTGQEVDLVMMIQGDEPLLDPRVVDLCIEQAEHQPDALVINVLESIESDDDFENSNVVKTVLRPDNSVLYFSREPIPSRRKWSKDMSRLKQLGLIAFRRQFLRTFASLAPTPLEQIESVDMLRVLEHGYNIQAVVVDAQSIGVDTPADLDRAAALLENDALLQRYRLAGRVGV